MSHNKYKFLIGAAVTAMSISLFAQTAPPATTCGNGVIDQGETCDLGTVNGVNNNDGTKGCSSSCQTMTAQGWKCVNSSDADYAQKITNTVTDPFTAPATIPLSFADLWK
nr:hypothetical protein [Gammaproteobacteria bacterium]